LCAAFYLFARYGQGRFEVTFFDHAQKGARTRYVGALSDIDKITLFGEDKRLEAS
jgi:hypothetical protein